MSSALFMGEQEEAPMHVVTSLKAAAIAGAVAAFVAGCGGGGDAGCRTPIVEVSSGTPVNGALSPGDCTVQQILDIDDQSLADRYRVALPPDMDLTIVMNSTEV